MALIIQKFGGTSVGNLERIRAVADRIIKTRALGHDVVVVVSAMAGETDKLTRWAQELSVVPDAREFDVLLATGEQVTIALLSLALIEQGFAARSYTGAQVPIRTDNAHNKARILNIDVAKIKADLSAGKVVVVAGFQGTDEFGNITTLGRGGSDTTAVALSAALQADECQIYTDVEGVYTADPKVVSAARLMSTITTEEMLEMSSNGAKVVQIRAVEFADRYNVPVRILSTFQEGKGTLMVKSETNVVYPPVTGIACRCDEVKIRLQGLPSVPGITANVLSPLSEAHIEVGLIVQTVALDGTTEFIFTVPKRDFVLTASILDQLKEKLAVKSITFDQNIAEISLIGIGIRSHVWVAAKMFQVLGEAGIHIQLISTSEIKLTVVVEQQYLEKGVRILHEAFQLATEPDTTNLNKYLELIEESNEKVVNYL